MNHKQIVEAVTAIALPHVERNGLMLWDVEYLKEGGQYYLRVTIDREGGVFIEDCEKVSRDVDPQLDGLDIEDSYILEVSSAGLERKLKCERDFLMFIGSTVLVRLYKARDGVKEFRGVLARYDKGAVTLNIGGEDVSFQDGEVSLVRLVFEMDLKLK